MFTTNFVKALKDRNDTQEKYLLAMILTLKLSFKYLKLLLVKCKNENAFKNK